MTAPAAGQDAGQVVLRNVAELAQRQQARELGSSLARNIFRLLKVAQFHALDNMAFLQQLDQTVEALGVFGTQTGEPLSLLFTKSTVFVSGQLLKASRAEYEAALELSEMVRKLGVTQLTIQNDATRADLKALARLFQPGSRVKAEGGVLEPSPRVRMRYVHAARLDENDNELSPDEQTLRIYAAAVVVMRRVYENLLEGRYQLPNQAKRLAQRLVVLSEGDTPAFLGVTGMRNLNHDAAGRAVNRSILAVAMGRQLTSDLATLSRIAMSALFFDVASPLVTGIAGKGDQVVVAQMTDQAEQRLPAATAMVLTALGQVREASMVRTVIAFEAHWLRQLNALGPLYDGAHRPMVAARIVATAHRFNQLVEPDLAADETPSVDDAISQMRRESKDALDQAMLVLLVGALGIFPRGAPVELSTGEKAVVLSTPDSPALYTRPTVRLVHDASGHPLRAKVVLDLAQDPERQVARVITDPDPELRAACAAVHQSLAPPSGPPVSRSQLAPASGEVEPAPSDFVPTRPPPAAGRASVPPASDGTPRSPEVAGSVQPPPPSSVPRSRRSVPPRSERESGAVELAEAPPSRRWDPRSEEFEPEQSPAPTAVAMRDSDGRIASQPSLAWRLRAASLPPKSRPEGAGRFSHSHAPSASGALERTPFPQLLLYMAERELGGSLVLTVPAAAEETDEVEHAVFFKRGIPTKAHVEARVAPLGSVLVGQGSLEQSQLESIALPTNHESALERELIDQGLVRPEQIAEVRSEQLSERLTFLFSLPATTRFAFYSGVDLLQEVWGQVPGSVSPRVALTCGLREHPDEAVMDRVLQPSEDCPLEMSAGAAIEDFEFDPDEIAVVITIATSTPSMNDLLAAGHDRAVVRRVVYELLLSRCATPLAAKPPSGA